MRAVGSIDRHHGRAQELPAPLRPAPCCHVLGPGPEARLANSLCTAKPRFAESCQRLHILMYRDSLLRPCCFKFKFLFNTALPATVATGPARTRPDTMHRPCVVKKQSASDSY
jgi:hypothetical protein